MALSDRTCGCRDRQRCWYVVVVLVDLPAAGSLGREDDSARFRLTGWSISCRARVLELMADTTSFYTGYYTLY